MSLIRPLTVAAMLAAISLPVSAGSNAPTNGPTPDQAWLMLREGNARYVNSAPEAPNTSAARRAELASGQNPFAIILSCADSRVPVEYAFDRGIGDLFVIRVAGNVSDTDEIGTIEYGVGHLHAPLVVVMGHTSCGAVKAVASGAEVHGSIPGLVDNIIPAVEWVKKNRPELTGDALVSAAIEANVWRSIDDLISRSSEVRESVASGNAKVIGAVYDIETGRVRWLGEHPYQDSLLSDASLHAPEASTMAQHAAPKPHAQPKNEDAAHEPMPTPAHAEAPEPMTKQPSTPSAPPSKKTANAPTHDQDEHHAPHR